MPFMEFSDRDPIPKWDFQEPGARFETLVTRAQFLATRYQYSCEQTRCQIVQVVAPSKRLVGVWQINSRRIKFARVKGFDLIIGAIRHHFRSYLEAEPEVQAEDSLVPIDEVSKRDFCGIHVANQQQTSLDGEWFQRDSSAKIEGFYHQATGQVDPMIKRSIYISRDSKQTRWLMPSTDLTRRTRLWNKYSETETKLEHHVNRGQAHHNSHAQAYPMEAETTTSSESDHYHNHKTSSDTESDQLDWDPERIDDDGYPLVDENGSTFVSVPREGPLEEDEASSPTAWAQGYREVRKNLRDSVTGRGYYKTLSQAASRKSCVKLCSRRNQRDETETCHWSRAEKTYPLLPLPTTWTYGERVSESSTEGHSPIFSQ